MFKRILVPLDLSDRHEAALRMASELAQQAEDDVLQRRLLDFAGAVQREDQGPIAHPNREVHPALKSQGRDF